MRSLRRNSQSNREKLLRVSPADLEAFVMGGAILGGGGGGWVEEGKKLGQLALERGFSKILPLSSLSRDELVVTVSAVGAPSAGTGLLAPEDYTRAVELLMERTRLPIQGLISSEVGALGVVNGWVQSAALGIPVVDAPANGRAHPLGLMGSMGLHRRKAYISRQAVVSGGGSRGKGKEFFFSGPLEEVSRKVLEIAAALGGMVAVARNPVAAAFVLRNGAPGALRMARKLGESFLSPGEPEERLQEIIAFFGRGKVWRAEVKKKTLHLEGGLDVGRMELVSGPIRLHLTLWNEYMSLEAEGKRLAAFPDLIMTFDADTSRPLISAEIEAGTKIYLLAIPRQHLLLGAGVRDRKLLARVENAVARAIAEQGDAS